MSLKAPEPPKQRDEMDDAVAQLKNSYGTKIDSVVKCIKETLKEKPDDKVWSTTHRPGSVRTAVRWDIETWCWCKDLQVL